MHRHTLATLILGTSTALAGLGCGSADSDRATDSTGDGGSGGADAVENRLEVFTWWVAPGEADALQALVDSYKDAYPDRRVTLFTDASAGDVLSVLGQDIDASRWDVAQLNASWLSQFVKDHPGSLHPVDDIYADPALEAAMIPEVLNTVTRDGHPMGVITGVHRGNAFHYNQQVLADHEIAPPTTVADFLDACEKLKTAGIEYPVAAALDGWVLRFLVVGMLQGILGPSAFADFINGVTPLADPTLKAALTEAIDNFTTVYTTYVDLEAAKAPGYDWASATRALYDGKAAMFYTGDWSKGYLTHLGWTPGIDFGVSGPPGAKEVFEFGPDMFVFPTSAPHPTTAREWLSVVASKEGQVAFNKYKGSTPMRTDVRDMLDDASKASLDDLVNAEVRMPAYANDTWDSAMVAYVEDGDRDALLQVWLTTEP